MKLWCYPSFYNLNKLEIKDVRKFRNHSFKVNLTEICKMKQW